MSKIVAALHHPDGYLECSEVPRGTTRVRKTWEYLAEVQEGRHPTTSVCRLCLPDPDQIAHDVIRISLKKEGA